MNSWASEKEGRGYLDPLDFEIISKKCYFFNFERQKPNFTTFALPLKISLGKSLLAPLEKVPPTPVDELMSCRADAVHSQSMGVSVEWSRCLCSMARHARDSVAPL